MASRRATPELACSLAQLTRSAVASALVALCGVALLLAARRVAGAMQPPADGSLLVLVGAILALAGAVLRCGWFWPFEETRRDRYDHSILFLFRMSLARCDRYDRAILCAPTVPLVIIATTLTFSETPVWITLTMWFLVLGGEAVSLHLTPGVRISFHPQAAGRGETTVPPSSDQDLPIRVADVGASAVRAHDSELAELAPEVLQAFTRSQLPDGSDIMQGRLRGHFQPDQRSISLHLAFCPPLAAVPVLNVEQLEGPDVSVKQVQVLPYGARLDLRRKSNIQESSTVLLEVHAVAREDD